MKIIGGKFKGRNFYTHQSIRPTQNLVRKAVFDMLGDLSGMDFLELFAGSGAVGWEAFSRGARSVALVEREPQCVEVIQENMRLFGIEQAFPFDGACRLFEGDVFVQIKHLAQQKKKFDVIFADPPYEQELGKKLLKTLMAHDILRPNCLIILQHYRREILPEIPDGFLLIRKKKYGTSILSIYTPH